ncbi:MAG: phosphoribosyl-AMP cyclohydrolase [Micrococcales bacterium]|nr:phosphoribosyl-AMP cyclohydrolase [Actinomycetota bacterium]NCA07216.1 phosphoribosyl-AMP cyclohydrolase [Micrococcales bacterium]
MSAEIQPKYDALGLVPVIVQDSTSGRVLMLAYMNAESYGLTKSVGTCHFYSRSRQEIWHKGATSGNYMVVQRIEFDCDSDSILVHVTPQGPACHNGTQSCFDTHQILLHN